MTRPWALLSSLVWLPGNLLRIVGGRVQAGRENQYVFVASQGAAVGVQESRRVRFLPDQLITKPPPVRQNEVGCELLGTE